MPITKKCRHTKAGAPPERCSCAWYGDLYLDGKRRWINLGHDKAEAQLTFDRHSIAKRSAQLHNHSEVAILRLSFTEVADEWLSDQIQSTRRPGTIHALRVRVNRAKRFFGQGPVGGITPAHVTRYATKLRAGYSGHTARSYLATFKRVLRFAKSMGYIAELPWPDEPQSFRAPDPKIRTLDEVEAVIQQLPKPFSDYAEFLMLTGLRVGEGLALTPECVDGPRLLVRHTRSNGRPGPTKTLKSNRTVILSPRAAEILAARPKGEYLWPFTYSQVRMRLYRLQEGQPNPVTWHTFRHANVALRHKAGEALRDSLDQLGHKNLDMTLFYGWTETQTNEYAKALDAARQSSGNTA